MLFRTRLLKRSSYSSYMLPASPPLYNIHQPPCAEPSLIHSPPNCFFSLARCSWKAGAARRISSAAFEKFPLDIGLAPENPAGSPSATQVVTRLKRTSTPTPQRMLSASPHINSSFMSCVWGILCLAFGEFICIRGQKAAL